jgi:hypothetical protein
VHTRRLTLTLAALSLGACKESMDTAAPPFEPSVEFVGEIAVLRVAGSPYEMGWAHGELLKDQLEEGAEFIEDSELVLLEGVANMYGLLEQAEAESYPWVVEECQGMVDAYGDEDEWSMARCLLLAYGDVVMEKVSQEWGCSQFVASGAASADGSVVHGRNLDWAEVSFMVDNPTLIVRHPEDGVPWVAFGFPGNISPYNGMNALGLSFASNEAHGTEPVGATGPAHTQMGRYALETYGTLDEVESFVLGETHASATTLVFADGDEGDARVLELAIGAQAARAMNDQGLILATNHFVDAGTAAVHQRPSTNSSVRYTRMEQLLEPDGQDSLYGALDLDTAVGVLRDTINATTGHEYGPELFDGGNTIANNGAIQALVMLPTAGEIYVASGAIPVPQRAYTGFSLDWLFGYTQENQVDPAEIPSAL